MKVKFEEICEKINNTKIEEIKDIIETWEIEDKEIEESIKTVLNEFPKIDKEKQPYLLEALYVSNDRFKFFLFCMLLEEYHTKLAYITNLENIALFKEKYIALIPTLIRVANDSYNGIADCMYLILLKHDPKGEFLSKEQKEEVLGAIAAKLTDLLAYYKQEEVIHQSASTALEILLDVTCYLNNEEIDLLIQDIVETNKLNTACLLFAIKNYVIHDIQIKEEIVNKVATNPEYAYRLYNILEKEGKQDIFPKAYNTQEYIARMHMIEWLMYPTELGKIPDEIECIGTIEEKDVIYYIYQFKEAEGAFKDFGYMMGISGGFPKQERPTSFHTGITFSKFQPIEKDYTSQAKEMVTFIQKYWQEKAEEIEE